MRVPLLLPSDRMPRCRHRERRGNQAAIGAAALAALVASLPSTAQAQSRLGATDVQRPITAPATAPLEADRRFGQRSDLTAARLLETARRDREQGQPEVARRVLEILIARFPDAASSEEARRELYEIYAASGRFAQPSPTPPHAAAQQAQLPASRAGLAQPWRTTVVGVRRLQDELRNSTGDRVFFGPGSADLGSRARAVLTAQATWMLARPGVDAIVEGHADDARAGADDERLAETRAAAVRDRLIAEGVEPERLQIAARGARDRVVVCDDAGCAAQNRRVILQVGVRQPQSTGNFAGPGAWTPPPEDLRR